VGAPAPAALARGRLHAAPQGNIARPALPLAPRCAAPARLIAPRPPPPAGAKRKGAPKGKESDQEEDKAKPGKKAKAGKGAAKQQEAPAAEPAPKEEDDKDAGKADDQQGKGRKASRGVSYKENGQFRTSKSDMVVAQDEVKAEDEADALQQTAGDKAGIKRRCAAAAGAAIGPAPPSRQAPPPPARPAARPAGRRAALPSAPAQLP
jgi:hypothetical protein